MLDLTQIKNRYFQVKVGGAVLDLEPPKMKFLKKLLDLSKSLTDGETGQDSGGFESEKMEELAEMIALMLSKNKKKKTISVEFVYENLGLDTMMMLLEGFFEWITEVQSDPN